MSIPISKYVAITSAIAKTNAAARKELIPRILTTNPLFATETVYEFTSSSDVADFAGALSQEAAIASEYFGWISKTATQAKKISFMRYSLEALAAYMYSTKALTPIATLKAVTDGSMTVNLGSTSYEITDVDLSSIAAYADVAAALQTKIQGNTSGGTLWTAATVTYNATNSSFELTAGETGANEINYAAAGTTGTDLSALLGWDSASAPILSNGIAAQTITEALNQTIDLSTNFLTIGIVNISDAYDNLADIGAWIDEQNNNYRFSFDLGASNYQEGAATAAQHTGMTAQYNINYGMTNIVPAWIMSCILPATTNYDKINGVKSYMYQEFPSQAIAVGDGDGTLYQTLDNLNINYNGQTQKAGKILTFYQNGFNADGTDTAIFDNEAWLKDAITSEIMNLFIGLDYVSADTDGIAALTGVITGVCDEALNNHVFSQGKELTNTQKAYITQLTGDENAWQDVQNNGYVFDIDITTETSGQATAYVAEYTLVYSKNDTIRKVEGSNILI